MTRISDKFGLSKLGLAMPIVIAMIFTVSLATANENNILLDSANSEYSKGDFTKASKLYENILSNGLEAPEVYFNLGNAYYKTNNIAFAILNYERALKLDPDNDDFNFNLKLANQKTEDKIDAAPQLFLSQWKNGLVDLMTEKGWSQLCILLICISLILFAIYITMQKRGLKQFGFFGGTSLVILCVITFFIAQHKYSITKNNSEAIIISPSITVTGSPNEKGTKLFILHAGTKVNVTQEDVSWAEIKIANGNTGWIKKTELQKI
ncbi:MAG: tetratricopeptide repeat protein [Bacteroidetes bacterium]|nr:tetratricopeptide repeat protein [Bacteroidota bacterium]